MCARPDHTIQFADGVVPYVELSDNTLRALAETTEGGEPYRAMLRARGVNYVETRRRLPPMQQQSRERRQSMGFV